MERPPLRGATGWQGQDARPKPPDWQSAKPRPASDVPPPRLKPPGGFERFGNPVVRGGRIDNTATLMREIEQMRRLIDDDSWMDNMPREELIRIRDRARAMAGSLEDIQSRLKPFKR